MRVWLQRTDGATWRRGATDVASAYARAERTVCAPAKIGADPAPKGQAMNYTVTAQGRLVTAGAIRRYRRARRAALTACCGEDVGASSLAR